MIAGVDGCKGGWLVIKAPLWPIKRDEELMVCRDWPTVAAVTYDCEVVAVDMPIGFPPTSLWPRTCDVQARQMLGSARTRVFFAPPRGALVAKSPTAFQSLHRRLTGKGAGYPVWPIVSKMNEIDGWITPSLQTKVREFHPELAWQRVNGNVPMSPKKEAAGQNQRRRYLHRHVAGLALMESWKKQLGRAAALDDLFDALIGLKVAYDIHAAGIPHRNILPATPRPMQRAVAWRFSSNPSWLKGTPGSPWCSSILTPHQPTRHRTPCR